MNLEQLRDQINEALAKHGNINVRIFDSAGREISNSAKIVHLRSHERGVWLEFEKTC